jgi:uncharacterized membrane protein
MPSNIVVLGFKDRYGAEGMLEDIHRWEEEGLIIAYARPDDQVEIQQTHRSEAGKFGLRGGGVGLVAGALLGGPVLGLIAGVTAGVIKGKRKNRAYGLDDDFVQAASGWLRAERSALFLLVKEGDAGALQAKLRPLTATVLTTTLAPDQERSLRQALAEEEY